MQPKRPVLHLYKLILRLHRGLPLEAKVIGDLYVREEFRRHKDVQPEEARIFLSEWTTYARTLAQQLGPSSIDQPVGRDMTEKQLTKLREEQLEQLLHLYKASTDDDRKS